MRDSATALFTRFVTTPGFERYDTRSDVPADDSATDAIAASFGSRAVAMHRQRRVRAARARTLLRELGQRPKCGVDLAAGGLTAANRLSLRIGSPRFAVRAAERTEILDAVLARPNEGAALPR